jgi:hypothetical protein
MALPKIGQRIVIEFNSDFSTSFVNSIISHITDCFLIIDLYPVPLRGKISSLNNDFLGILLPGKPTYKFSIGISINFLIFPPKTKSILYSNSYPVYQIFSGMTGSAVAISENIIVTNAHVVQQALNSRLRGVDMNFTTIKIGTVIDLALASCKGSLRGCQFAEKFIQGERIKTVGFAIFQSDFPLITEGYLAKIVHYRGIPVLGMISARTFNGQSGGGVFNDKNELIGIITANANNVNDKVYEDLGFCILHTVFTRLGDINASISSELWEDNSEEFKELFSFQTSNNLPLPKI